MPNILDILARAQSLMNETALNSITPPRAGGIMYDTLLVLNQMQLEGGSLLISKIYTSVSAMEADTTPTSDLTGRALRAGQLVVIVPSDTSSADLGKVYRYNGPDSWSYTSKIGGLPLDTAPAQGSTNGITSGAVYTIKQTLDGEVATLEGFIEQLDQEIEDRTTRTDTIQTLTVRGTQYKNVYVGDDTSIGQVGEIVDTSSEYAFALDLEIPQNANKIRFPAHKWSGKYGYAFLDGDGVVLAAAEYPSTGTLTFDLPSGTVRAHISFYLNTDKTIQIFRTVSVSEDITEINESLGSVEEALGGYEAEVITKVLTDQGLAARTNVYVGNDTSIGQVGDIVSTSNDFHAAQIDLQIGTETVRYYIYKFSGDYGYAFFNSEGVVIESKAHNQVVTSSGYKTLPVPEGAAYVRMPLQGSYRSVTLQIRKNIPLDIENLDAKIGRTDSRVDGLSGEIRDIEERVPAATAIPHYQTLGSPVPYLSGLDTTGVSTFNSVSSLYDAWDALAAEHPSFLKKEADIGMDETDTYAIRHYTLRFQHPDVNTSRDGSGTNVWSDSTFKIRRLLLNMSVHSTEKWSTCGGYHAIKAILESSEDWAKFIKDNFIIDIVPCNNPWGLDNSSSNNSNGVNLNRDYDSATPQAETAAMKALIQDLKGKGLVGIIDLHNTGSGDGYLVSKTTYKRYHYYARLAQQIQGLFFDQLNTVFGEADNHFHLWLAGESGQLHEYADQQNLLGVTLEIKTTAAASGALLTKGIAVNLMAAFGTYEG